MTPEIPFLYLPDAITLMFILGAARMLRAGAISHLRQELLGTRKEMILYWVNNGLNTGDRGFRALRDSLESSMTNAPRLSPARLIFLDRFQRKIAQRESGKTPPDPSHEVHLLIEGTGDKKARDKLKRFQTESNMALGTFFLFGSLSGWFLSFVIAARMLKRTLAQCKKNRTDFFFDMLERVLAGLGRKGQQLGLWAQR
jgi:hypothetical protein